MPSTISVGYSSLCSSSVATGMICSFDELAHELDQLVLLLGEAVRGLESGHAWIAAFGWGLGLPPEYAVGPRAEGPRPGVSPPTPGPAPPSTAPRPGVTMER